MGLINTIVTEHFAEASRASSYYCTVVAPGSINISRDDLAAIVAGKTPDPIMRDWRFELVYPSVSKCPAEAIEQTRTWYLRCARCHLSARRNRVAFYRGSPEAAVVFIGEGPGAMEDEQGVPFVGPSGRLQDRLLEGVGIDSAAIGWMNIVGCRPTDRRFGPDRPPTIVEQVACSERTLMLLRAVRPSVVVCLGKVACGMFWSEAPPPWTWHAMPWGLIVGHGRHPSYLLRRIMVKGGEAERVAAARFYATLRERMPHLRKLPLWPASLNYMVEASQRVFVGT